MLNDDQMQASVRSLEAVLRLDVPQGATALALMCEKNA